MPIIVDEEPDLNPIVRDDTLGMVRNIGLWGAFVFGIHCISLSSSGYLPFSSLASIWPGASIVGVLTVSMLISLVHGYTFAAIGTAQPKQGADFELARQVLHPAIAFVASWTLLIFSGIVAGGLAAWIPKSALPALLRPMAILYKNEAFSSWASYAESTGGSMVLGTGCVVLTFFLMLLPKGWIIRILSVGLALGVAAWIVIFISLGRGIAAGPDAFAQAWDSFMATTGPFGAYDRRIELARAAGMTTSVGPVTMTLAGLIMGFWIYYGYSIPTFFAGEVKRTRSGGTMIIACWSAIICSWLIFTIAALMLQRLVPAEWIAAEGYIYNNPSSVEKVAGQPVPALPWITFYAAILYPNRILVFFTAFAWIFTLVNLVQTYFFYCKSIIFAWASENFIPRWIGENSDKTDNPIICLALVALLAEVGVYDAARGGPLNTQLTFVFIAAVTQLVSVVSIIIYPYRRPEHYRIAPAFVRSSICGVPAISIIGVVTLAYLLWLIAAFFIFAQARVSDPSRTLVPMAVVAAIGLVVYYLYKGQRLSAPKATVAPPRLTEGT